MKAIVYDRYGDSALRLAEVPDPKVGPDRVLVRVRAAGVNQVDWKTQAGQMDSLVDAMFPVTPGFDVAGVVESVGFTVTGFHPGDEVIGYVWMDYLHHGTYAELVSAPVRTLARKPSGATWEEAAGLPLAGLTALQALTAARVGPGDVVLMHGASGGVGSLGAQIAVHLGARVVGTASEGNHEFLRSLGVEPVRYGGTLVDEARALAPAGFTKVVDYFGGGALAASVELLAAGFGPAEMVTVADAAGAMALGAGVVGVRPSAEDLERLAGWVDEGALRVHVDHAFPFEQAAEAHRLSRAGHVRGKLVLTVA